MKMMFDIGYYYTNILFNHVLLSDFDSFINGSFKKDRGADDFKPYKLHVFYKSAFKCGCLLKI